MAVSADTLPGRSLSPMQGALMAWLEAERRATVTIDEVAVAFPWSRASVRHVLHRLARNGWLRRTARGRYEVLLAETAGFAPPNPWAALALWTPRHYVGFQSAAYERGLTPDRPGDVQVCIDYLAPKRPESWEQVPIDLIRLRTFSMDGVEREDVHGWTLALAGLEKIVADSALLPRRVGGVGGLTRIVSRALDEVAWAEVERLATANRSGRAALRRIAALLELIGSPVPADLQHAAGSDHGRREEILLAEPQFHGTEGQLLERWVVRANVDPGLLREKIAR